MFSAVTLLNANMANIVRTWGAAVLRPYMSHLGPADQISGSPLFVTHTFPYPGQIL